MARFRDSRRIGRRLFRALLWLLVLAVVLPLVVVAAYRIVPPPMTPLMVMRLAEGESLAAEFVNQGEAFQAIRFADPNGRVDYYTPEGRSVRKAFVRAPLSFSRVSSNFNPRRRHPKLNTIRAHRGVDYAAPRGTPIKAAGDGKVIFRGVKSGYGNTIILQHGGNITTLYAHMSRFSSGARVGGPTREPGSSGTAGSISRRARARRSSSPKKS